MLNICEQYIVSILCYQFSLEYILLFNIYFIFIKDIFMSDITDNDKL